MIKSVPILAGIVPISKWDPSKSQSNSEFHYIDIGSIDRENKQLCDVVTVNAHEAPSRAKQVVKRGDVLISTVRPNLNAVARVPDEYDGATASTGFTVLRPDNRTLDSKYLFYWVRTPLFINEMVGRVSGANYPAVSDKIVKESKIPLPSFSEQKRIAAILDKADAIRKKRKKAIELTETFLRSAFLEMFGDPVTNPMGWEANSLEDVAEIEGGVTKGRKFNGKATVLVPYMRVANVQDGHIRLDDIAEIEVLPEDVDKYSLQTGDLLLTEGGDPDKLGRGAVWKGVIDPCIHQNHIFRVRSKSEIIMPEYLSTLIGSQRGKGYFLRAAKQTTGIATINKTQLKGFSVLIPPLELQKKWDSLVTKKQLTEGHKRASVETIDFLFNSLAQKAFRGEL